MIDIPKPGEFIWLSSADYIELKGSCWTPARPIVVDYVYFDEEFQDWLIISGRYEFFASDCMMFEDRIVVETLGILD